MANTQTIGADKALGLDELNQWISENEQILGPIIEIEDGGVGTAGVFDLYQPRVRSKFAKVFLKVGAQCVLGQGWTLIYDGQAYIAGVLSPVCLARQA
jgi:hypothetical protein